MTRYPASKNARVNASLVRSSTVRPSGRSISPIAFPYELRLRAIARDVIEKSLISLPFSEGVDGFDGAMSDLLARFS